MTKLDELYFFAESRNIFVDLFELRKREALSVLEPDGTCFIAIDPQKVKGDLDEAMKLAHEIGHCETGAFYNKYAACDVRKKHENKADIWAIKHKLSAEDLDNAIADGYTETWSLAEYFEVTEDFMKKAVCYYTYGNLDVDIYF